MGRLKLKKLTIIFLALLALALGGVLVLSFGSTPLIAEQVKFEPKPFDLGNPDGVTAHVKLSVDDVPIVDQINASTVRLEGIVPFATWVTTSPPIEFIAQFDGETVAQHVMTKIGHMGLPPQQWVPIKVDLTITGKLDDGTPWEGTGEIKVYVPDDPPPPPPPPP